MRKILLSMNQRRYMGLILPQTVKIRPRGKSIEYYVNLGYTYRGRELIDVDVNDLLPGTTAIVKIKCDFCGKEYELKYVEVSGRLDNICCSDCRGIKITETNMKKYGVTSTSKIFEVKQKQLKTLFDNYGVTNPMLNSEIKSKFENTMLKNYGVKYSGQSDVLLEKRNKTCIKKYGTSNVFSIEEFKLKRKETLMKNYAVENPMFSTEIKERLYATNIERYGFKNPTQNVEIKHKICQSLYKNGTCKCSAPQKYIHNLYGGDLNYPISRYNVDIFFKEKNIYLEYDGGMHSFDVKLGRETAESFIKKQIIRYNILKKAGLKSIRLTSATDKLPSDEVLIKIKNFSIFFLENFDDNWIEINLDTLKIITIDNKISFNV